MEERKDICEGYERDSVQQLDKLAKDKNERFPIYPLTYIQAVYDARTKERLDSILWKCNNVYLPWTGSAGDTRIQLPFWMRRKGIIITYKNLDEETITEKLTYDLCIADDFFRLDSSWTRITDALPVGGNITIGSNGNWFQDGVDTGFKAQGPKGDNGLTPMLRTVNNKLRYSYDGEVWYEISEYIAAWFRYQDNKIQISRDQKTWSDLSKPFTQDLYIKGYVATSSALPSTGVKQGDIYMVGPTYAAEDSEHKNPIYRMYVYNDSGWVDNGVFQSIAAGVVQTIGNSETEVMSQKAVSSIVGLDTYPVFSDTKPYVKGDIVNYGGLLYEFTADHEAGAWIGTDARETSLREEIRDIGDKVSSIESWRILLNMEYTELPEWICVKTDAEGKVLYGVRIDGNFECNGVPKDVQKAINLIQSKFNELGSEYISNGEWLRAYLDSDGKLLQSIDKNGITLFPKQDTYYLIKNEEWLMAIVDSLNHVLFGIQKDGNTFIAKQGNIDRLLPTLNVINGIFESTDNPEYIYTITDADGKILIGIKIDGTLYLPFNDMYHVISNKEYKYILEDSQGKIIFAIDNNNICIANINVKLKNLESINAKIKSIESIKETTDELNVNNSINLGDSALTDLETALKNHGFTPNSKEDWSNSTSLDISTPRCAVINISNITYMPTTKKQNLHSIIEFWDMQGNYFKKKAILNAQGNSSMIFIKKNFAADFCNDDWIGDDTFKIKFGKWVPQDSFHFKAYYTDFFKGIAVVSYKIADEIDKLRGQLYDRPWKRALLNVNSITSDSSTNIQNSNLNLAMDNGARCMPDGFPVKVYLNNEFYGLYCWQIKKHRDNYCMNKKIYTHIHLDGTLTQSTLWNANGDSSKVDWKSFEIRNPKSLIDINGDDYDGDNPKELIDASCINYDSSNKKHKNTVIVKDAILKLTTYVGTLKDLKNSGADDETIRMKIEEMFDIPSLIDYTICNSCITRDTDGYGKNWQWITYDGIKWYVCEYDKDMSFGNDFSGKWTNKAITSGSFLGNDINLPTYWVIKYFKQEIKDKWAELRENGIANHEHILSLVEDWMHRIGEDGYELEYSKWSESPCFRDNGIKTDYWRIYPIRISSYNSNITYSINSYVYYNNNVYKSLISSNLGNPITDTDKWKNISYNPETNYIVNDVCSIQTVAFICIKECVGIIPTSIEYKNQPFIGGYYDSYWRLAKYIEQTINIMNKYITEL